MKKTLVVVCLCAAACAGPSLEQRRQSALPALQTLQAGAWEEAEQEAARALVSDKDNPYALIVDAITRYKKVIHQLFVDLVGVAAAIEETHTFNQQYLRYALEHADTELAVIDGELERVSRHRELTFDLCLACWEYDWNHNGRVDKRDRRLFEVELDQSGTPYPADDPRRRPTFRFDQGDVLWARAFLSFQRAAIDLALAYDWTQIETLLKDSDPERPAIKLTSRERVAKSKQLILDGLDLAEQARQAYLAETDDEREWLPNPRQKDHPLPLPVDAVLYQTWGDVIADVRLLIKGERALRMAEVAELLDEKIEPPPVGYLDVGGLFSRPRDIAIDVPALERCERDNDIECFLNNLFGDWYVKQAQASQLPLRVRRMKSEVDRGEESLERKLRYLIWLN
ncbi:MAG: hypothetical protein JXR83_01205 [Deltaproteobacteria bacterium]|nr:hypothetical protein [Deltaproteobacteria bacterium]